MQAVTERRGEEDIEATSGWILRRSRLVGYMDEDWGLGPAAQSGNMAKDWPTMVMVKKLLLGVKPVTQ